MKKTLMMLMLTLGSSLLAQESGKMARVQSIDGKQVFILNTPLRTYKEVAEVKTGIKISSLLTRGLLNEGIDDKSSQFVRKAYRKLDKKDLAYDAIIYDGTKKAKAIKFTEKATEQNDAIASINDIDGVGMFVLAEPLSDYRVETLVRGGVNIVPFITYGWLNPSIEKDMKRFIKSADRKGDPEYIAYSAGRKAAIISFE